MFAGPEGEPATRKLGGQKLLAGYLEMSLLRPMLIEARYLRHGAEHGAECARVSGC